MTRRGLFGGAAIAASVAGTLLLTRPPLGLWPSLAELTADHRTGAGERYAFDPVAGVQVEMNSRTSLSLTGGGHGIALIGGEAFVTVDARSRPFEVVVGDMRIVARQADFNVRAVDGQIRVACVEGSISCERGDEVTALGVGDQFGYAGNGVAVHSTIDPATALAWRRGLLIFDGTALADVIAEINRYRAGNIVLADSALGNRQVNGIFHTAQIDNTVAQIQRLLNIRVRYLPAGVVLMG